MGSATWIEETRGVQVRTWSGTMRVAFRFVFVYFGLYCLTTQILTALVPLPNLDIPDPSVHWPIRPVVLWTAKRVLRMAQAPSFAETGSGDRRFDWVLVFCLLVIAVVATGIWSLVDRKRAHYVSLHKWFRVAIRFSLAGQMMAYGWAKAVPLQMPFPFLTRLLEPYGNFSPMGVLWASMGASPGYEIFAGCAELLGGVLLIFPRTAMLGALVCMADMTQVFMLNMTYDVPVKLLSFHLWLLAGILLAPDAKRLVNFFVLNRVAEPPRRPALFAVARWNWIALAAQILFGAWLFGMNAYGGWVGWHQYGGGRTKSALYGIWEVQEQRVDGQERAPLLTDAGRWRRLIFDSPERMTFQRIDDSFAGYGVKIKDTDRTIELAKPSDKNWKGKFTFERTSPEDLRLEGEMDGHQTYLQLKLMDRSKFLLVNRGFHWVQEGPFNR